MLTIHPSIGWPVASSHALLAFSRTPSRSAPVMASLSGRSETGPLLVKAERTQSRPLLISDQGLISGHFVFLADHLPAEGTGDLACVGLGELSTGQVGVAVSLAN